MTSPAPPHPMRSTGFPAALLAVATLASQPAVLTAQRDTLSLRPAYRLVDQYVTQAMADANTPGLALAIVGRDEVLTVRTYGYADLDRRKPVKDDTRFEIGSISKSFTAIALLQLQAEKRFDPKQPVRNYLPWFTPKTQWRPVTGHDLLTHTSGMPRDRDDIPSSPAQGYFARYQSLGSAPGTRWSYSNIGFQVLGVLLESLEHAAYADIIRRRILEPLRMKEAEAEITHDTRRDLARGYRPLYDDRPSRTGDPLVPAEWIESAAGDGSIVASAPQLGRYLRMLLNHGRGPSGRVLPEKQFDLLMTRHARIAPDGAFYGYGMFLDSLGGRPVFWHSGGMIGYAAYLIGDPTLGIGVVALVNGPGNPGSAARFALSAVAALIQGDSMPSLQPARRGPAAGEYAGTYTGPSGDSLVFAAADDSLLLLRGPRRDLLSAHGADAFLGPVDDFPLFPLRFGRDSTGVTEVWYGDLWYAGSRYRGSRRFTAPPEWKGFAGHYRIMQPWEPDFRIVLRKGGLWFIGPDGGEEPMTALAGGSFRVGDPDAAERIRFDEILDGRAMRATMDGMTYYRFFTP